MNTAESTDSEIEHVSLPSMISSTLALVSCFCILYISLTALSILVFWMFSIFILLDFLFLFISYRIDIKKRKSENPLAEDINKMNNIRKGLRFDLVFAIVLAIALIIRPGLDVVAALMFGGNLFAAQSMNNLGKVMAIRVTWIDETFPQGIQGIRI